MAIFRNKRILVAWKKENCEQHPRSILAQNSNVPWSQENYITQVSEEFQGRVTKKLSQELSRTENRILGALARLDDFLMNPLIQGHYGTAPETSRNIIGKKQGTSEDNSQSDLHPEAGIFSSQTTQNAGSEVGHDTLLVRVYHRPKNMEIIAIHIQYCDKETEHKAVKKWDTFVFVVLQSMWASYQGFN